MGFFSTIGNALLPGQPFGNRNAMPFQVGAGLSSSAGDLARRTVGINTANAAYTPNIQWTPAYTGGTPNFSIGAQPRPAATVAQPKRTTGPAPVQNTLSAAAKPSSGQIGGLKTNAQNRAVDPNQAYLQLIEDQYRSNADYLGGLRNSYQSELSRSLGGVDDLFSGEAQTYAAGRSDLLAQNQSRKEGVRQQGANALDEAKLLYNELSQAGRQRYGGTSSTGDFAQALQGREFQKQQGNIQQTTATNIQELNLKDAEIERGYQAQVAQLESTKRQYIQDLKSQFDEKIRQIDASKLENENQKAAQKLDLLREINQRATDVDNYIKQMQANFNAQAVTAKQNLYGAYQEYLINAGQAPDLANIPQADYSTIGGYAQGPQVELPQGFFKQYEDQGYTPQGFFRPEEA